MKQNKQNPHGIETPTTVENFRQNLKKHYLMIGDKYLYCQENDRIKIDEIKSFQDIYEQGGNFTTLMGGKGPHICPMVTLNKDIQKHMLETGQTTSCYGYFDDEDNFTLWDDQYEFLEKGDPKWVTLDNQIYRDFYMMTLGQFCGYDLWVKEVG